MNKEGFLTELRARLSGLPQSDIEERVAFYSEMIDDRMEEGVPEEEAVAGIGTIDELVEQIMSETPLTTLVKEKVKPKRELKVWEVVLLVLGAPVWIPLVLAAIIVILAVYVVIWAAVICIYAADLSMAVGAVAGVISAVGYLTFEGNPAGALFAFGGALLFAGGAILLFFASVWITRYILKLSKGILLGIKSSFIGKEA